MKQSRAVFFMVSAAAFWGLGTVASRWVLDDMPPVTLLVVQLVVSVSFLWLILLLTGQPFSLGEKPIHLGLAGILNPGLAYSLGLVGLSMTTASMSSLIWAVEPAIILGLAWIILKERPGTVIKVFSMVALAGSFLVISGAATLESGGSPMGILLIAVAVLFCALYTVITRRSVGSANPISLAAVQLSVSLALALLFWLTELNSGVMETLATIDPVTWIWAGVTGLIYYALAFLFYVTGLKKMEAAEAALYLNLIPIFGVVGALLFLDEQLAPIQWLGALISLFAILAITLFQRDRTVLQRKLPGVQTLLKPKSQQL